MPAKKSKSLKASISGEESIEPSTLRAASEEGGITPPIKVNLPELPEDERPQPTSTDEIQPIPPDSIGKDNPGPAAPLPGKPAPAQASMNHFHIPANPERLKLKEMKDRLLVRQEKARPTVITNEIIYDLLMDILANQELLAGKLQEKQTVTFQSLSGGLQRVDR
ncbi:hypothetical protein ACFFSY_21990 [Paenibacillus aurantiacus]|uniref:Uncharacterized protein n=1 Tax=Paenibacillus aurantiacus TaxID=1936118 RepID=A0ABV5KTQ2_9BACL